MKNVYLLLAFSLMVTISASAQKFEGIALTPPMGWNSWNCFAADINEQKIMEIADAMVSSGMKDAGYKYVIIDDGWMSDKRDEAGHIIVDSLRFPHGIKPLIDYVHQLGLKFGIYSAPGCYTCEMRMGSLGHEQTDASDYADWGVDLLKYDWCKYPKTEAEARETSEADCRAAYELMRDCLYKTGRPIVYLVHDKCTNMSEEGGLPWVKGVAHLHRTSSDIKNTWDRMLYCLESTADLWEYAGPGYWNDPDILEVGNEAPEDLWGGRISSVKMNVTEYRTHFSMWCMVAAPLFAGNDLRTMSREIVEILTNGEMIAVNQDPLGKQGRRVRQIANGDQEVWVKELSGNRRAVALFNRSSNPADIRVTWDETGLTGNLKVRDLWAHKDLGRFDGSFTGRAIDAHEAMILLIEK